MTVVAVIVEGDGEVAAFPILLRRIGQWRTPEVNVTVSSPPIRVRKDRFLNKEDEFNRMLKLAAAKCGEDGWILILLDADDDCPARLSRSIVDRAAGVVPHRHVSVVLANREYEAWFLAAAQSLNNHRGFAFNSSEPVPVEEIRNAKGWMAARMAAGAYRETTDQPSFSAKMDLEMAYKGSRSFRKLCHEWSKQAKALE
jgi:hypothetical protein